MVYVGHWADFATSKSPKRHNACRLVDVDWICINLHEIDTNWCAKKKITTKTWAWYLSILLTNSGVNTWKSVFEVTVPFLPLNLCVGLSLVVWQIIGWKLGTVYENEMCHSSTGCCLWLTTSIPSTIWAHISWCFFLTKTSNFRFIPVCLEFVRFDCLICWVMLEASSSSDGTKRAAEVAVFHQDIFLLDWGDWGFAGSTTSMTMTAHLEWKIYEHSCLMHSTIIAPNWTFAMPWCHFLSWNLEGLHWHTTLDTFMATTWHAADGSSRSCSATRRFAHPWRWCWCRMSIPGCAPRHGSSWWWLVLRGILLHENA